MEKPVCYVCQGDVGTGGVSLCACKGSMAVVHMDCVLDVMAKSGGTSCTVCKTKYGPKDDKISGGALLRLFQSTRSANGRVRNAARSLTYAVFWPDIHIMTDGLRSNVKCAMLFMGLIVFVMVVLLIAALGLLHDAGWQEGSHVVSDLMIAIVVLFIVLGTTHCVILQFVTRRAMSDIATDWADVGCGTARAAVEP